MRVLIFSDVHANLTALDAVLRDAGVVDQIWCLGDLVGYGPDPNECVQRVRSLPNFLSLLGNHDVAALGQIDTSAFNTGARNAIHWTRDTLLPENINYLARLPQSLEIDDKITLAHGSPRKPVWEYIINERIATQNFPFFNTHYCFVGHSHLPAIYHLRDGQEYAYLIEPAFDQPTTITPRTIINPGSVGQPRDRNPDSSYLVLDTEDDTIEYRRTPYDIEAVQNRMAAAGLPGRYIERLKTGR
ncbi:MAG: metallophosphoesterase family protein [Chloroflexi bacterium]|nr:metallophosphoesterase family protein [Chloroflexota bacterium]